MCCFAGEKPPPPQPPAHQLPAYNSQGYRSQHAMTPSSSGMFYPGSNFAKTPEGSTRQNSHGSTSSNISIESAQHALNIIQRSQSMQVIVEQMGRDFDGLQATLQYLEAWMAARNPNTYQRRREWSEAMQRAYNRYKKYDKCYTPARRAFNAYFSRTKENTTPEQHVTRAKMAIEWGNLALQAAETRVDFMRMYRDAFDLPSLDGHIEAAQNDVNSGRAAVHEAGLNYKKIWELYKRDPHPTVFR